MPSSLREGTRDWPPRRRDRRDGVRLVLVVDTRQGAHLRRTLPWLFKAAAPAEGRTVVVPTELRETDDGKLWLSVDIDCSEPALLRSILARAEFELAPPAGSR